MTQAPQHPKPQNPGPQRPEPQRWTPGPQHPQGFSQQGGPPPSGQYPPPLGSPQPRKRSSRRGLLIGVVIGIVVLVGFGSCVAVVFTTAGRPTAAPVPTTASASARDTSSEPSSAPTEEDDPSDDDLPPGKPGDTGGIGDQFTYTRTRITVSITSATMESYRSGTFLLVQAKIKNRSKTPFDPSSATLSVSYGAKRSPAERVGIAGVTHNTFGGDIAPKKSKTAKFGYRVTKKQAKKLQIHFSPDADRYRYVLVTGSAK